MLSLLRAHEGVTEDRVEVESREHTHTENHPLHTRIDHTLERAIPRARSLVARAMRWRASRTSDARSSRAPQAPSTDATRVILHHAIVHVFHRRLARTSSVSIDRASRGGGRRAGVARDVSRRARASNGPGVTRPLGLEFVDRVRRRREMTRGGDVGLVGAGILRVLVGVDARVGVGAGVGVGVAREGGENDGRARARWVANGGRARARGRGEDDGESA